MLQLGLAPVRRWQSKLRDRHQCEKPSRQEPRHPEQDVRHASTAPIGGPIKRGNAKNQAACNIDDKPSIILIRALSIIVTALTASSATYPVTWPAIGNECTALRLRLKIDSGIESGTEWGANCAIYPLFSWEFLQTNRTENPGVVSSILTLPIVSLQRKFLPIADLANLPDAGQRGQSTQRKRVVCRIWSFGDVRTLAAHTFLPSSQIF